MGGEKDTLMDEAAGGRIAHAVLVGDEGEAFVVVDRDEVVGSSPTGPNVVEPQHETNAASTPAPFVPEAFEAIGASLSSSSASLPPTIDTPATSAAQSDTATDTGASTNDGTTAAAPPSPQDATATEVAQEVLCAYAIVAYHEALWLAEKAYVQAKAARRRWEARGPVSPAVKRVVDHKFFPVLVVVVLSLLVTLPAYWAIPSTRGGQRRLSSREWQAMYEDLSSKHSAESVRHRLKYDKLAGKHVELQAEYDSVVEVLESERTDARGAGGQPGSCLEHGVDGCQAKDESESWDKDYLAQGTVAAAKEAYRVAEQSAYDMFRHFSDGLREDLHEIADFLRGGGGGRREGSPGEAYDDAAAGTATAAAAAAANNNHDKATATAADKKKKSQKKVKKEDGKGEGKAKADKDDKGAAERQDYAFDVLVAVGRALGLPDPRGDVKDGDEPKVGPVDVERRGADGDIFDVVLPARGGNFWSAVGKEGGSKKRERETLQTDDMEEGREGEERDGGDVVAPNEDKKKKKQKKQQKKGKHNKKDNSKDVDKGGDDYGLTGGPRGTKRREGVEDGRGGDQDVRVEKVAEVVKYKKEEEEDGSGSGSGSGRKPDMKDAEILPSRAESDENSRRWSYVRHPRRASGDTVVVSQEGDVARSRLTTDAEKAGRSLGDEELNGGQGGKQGKRKQKKKDKVAKKREKDAESIAFEGGKGLKKDKESKTKGKKQKQLKREDKESSEDGNGKGLKKDKGSKTKGKKKQLKREDKEPSEDGNGKGLKKDKESKKKGKKQGVPPLGEVYKRPAGQDWRISAMVEHDKLVAKALEEKAQRDAEEARENIQKWTAKSRERAGL